ncbi:hypothetical protein [Paraburkholderia sp. RL17-337-BIB-A]|uniref:hypothetical protein n=1 Tax=Paraburkholderia sp. RL17-337-BIB-A TaxID=3031636 RepID=UPI0038B74BA8
MFDLDHLSRDVWTLNTPFSVLDPSTREKLWQDLLNDQNGTFIGTTSSILELGRDMEDAYFHTTDPAVKTQIGNWFSKITTDNVIEGEAGMFFNSMKGFLLNSTDGVENYSNQSAHDIAQDAYPSMPLAGDDPDATAAALAQAQKQTNLENAIDKYFGTQPGSLSILDDGTTLTITNGSKQVSFDGTHTLISTRDASGNITASQYDQNGVLQDTMHINASNGLTDNTVYQANGQVEHDTYATNGNTTQDIYDTSGHLIQENDILSAGGETDHAINPDGTQTAMVFDANGHETEYATFGTNDVKTQDLFYDATTGHLTQENDFNADGSQTDHIINSDGTQNAIVYNASGHETEYATFNTNGTKTQDLFYDATTGNLTRENDFNADGSQTDHIINSDGTQNSVVFDAAGHETEYATFNANGAKTQDLFYNATTGQLTQEDDFNADGSQIDRVYNTNGMQSATVFNAGGHETEQATFDASGKISKDLVFDGKTGAELQETDYNANGSGVAHIFNPDGTQNAAVFDPSGHISEYATYGTNGKLATDIFYDANGRATQYNEYTSNQITTHQFNADNTQTATVYNSAGQETEFARFDTSGHKTDDYFFNGSTGRETQYDSYGSDGSMVEHLFNSDNSQDAIIYDASGRETQYDAFNSQGQLTGFTDFTYTVGGGYDALAYGPTGFETGWSDYNGDGSLISSSGGQYNFSLDDGYGDGTGDWDFSAPVYDDGYASDFGFYY